MKQYIPIATIDTPDEIINYFPIAGIKGDEANIIVNAFLAGNIKARCIKGPDEESFIGIEEAVNDKRFLLTIDGKYGVRFTKGSLSLLWEKKVNHGFFIDIYKADDCLDTHSNELSEFARFISKVLLVDKDTPDETGVMIEMPDGEVVPVSYAWYDSLRNMVRISFEKEEYYDITNN